MKERSIFIIVLSTLVILVIAYLVAVNIDVLPNLAASRALAVDRLFRVMVGIAVVIFLAVEGALLYAVIQFRRRRDDVADAAPYHGNNTLELVWTLIPAIIVFAIGFYSFDVLTQIESTSTDELVVEVVGRQFAWEFRYPEYGVTSSVVHLPVDQAVRFEITSEDVIHSFWVPNFLAKRDATPGQVSDLRITPTEIGRYPVRCAELCGAGHAAMVSEVIVEDAGEFERWIEAEQAKTTTSTSSGRDLFIVIGCNACHSLQDAQAIGLVGPSLDGIQATAAEREAGVAAAEYIRKSILNPDAYIVDGYQQGLMPRDYSNRLSEAEIELLTSYLVEQ